ncbi:MAG: ATP-grasp domain-containing protein [Haliscomenobacter sp.]|nr:ATP-grasp domain-containing protein [Haliscomenobacter sp.]
MFNKILIANRGEIALRVIRTCREMGIKTVAVYSTADRESLHVRKKIASEIGYPVILKATAGGGGKGMRVVWDEKDFETAWSMARQEAKAAFGNDGIYVEKFIEEPRHIEIQVAGDQFGKVIHLSERDCSIQRRHQKLMEETPSPFMTPELRDAMGQAAILAAEAINYEGVGTVEFLVDKFRNFYFMEMNTRIQVEHPVTEEVTDHDLIKEMVKIAAGERLQSGNLFPSGHAIECRINAEDVYNGFRPSPGKITSFHSSKGHGVRVDTHVYAGYTIPPYYDSMIAKIICRAPTRNDCITKMERALDEFIIEGINTTVPFHQKLMKDENFRKGDYHTGFLNNFNMKD